MRPASRAYRDRELAPGRYRATVNDRGDDRVVPTNVERPQYVDSAARHQADIDRQRRVAAFAANA